MVLVPGVHHDVAGRPLLLTDASCDLVSDLAQDLCMGRSACLVAGKGAGKSALVRVLARVLGYSEEHTTTVHLYKDMGSRDLLLRRATDKTGNTIWEPQPLVTAAIDGGLVVLDGIHRLPPDTLSIIAPLLHDKVLMLPNGKQLMQHERFDAIKGEQGMGDDDMAASGVLRIHPCFRVVALASPPSLKQNWLLPETASLFTFHVLHQPSPAEHRDLLAALFPDTPSAVLHFLAHISAQLDHASADSSSSPGAVGSGVSLSVRHLIRLARRVGRFPQDLEPVLRRTCMSAFLPPPVRESLERLFSETLASHGAALPRLGGLALEQAANPEIEIEEDGDGGRVSVGGVVLARARPANAALVPSVVFFDIPKHRQLLHELFKDISCGERHLLVIGNQGVGKNKVVDRMLGLLQVTSRVQFRMEMYRELSLTFTPLPCRWSASTSSCTVTRACNR